MPGVVRGSGATVAVHVGVGAGSPTGQAAPARRGSHSSDDTNTKGDEMSSMDINRVMNTMSEFPVRITRQDLVRTVTDRVTRDDSFSTLPFTVVQLVLFIVLIDKHLRVYQRQEMESALQDWVMGTSRGLTGPFVADHVGDGPGLWDWMEESGLPAIYGGEVDRSSGTPLIQLASTSVLLGDSQLWQRRADGSESAEWLLHTAGAQSELAASPGAFVGTTINTTRRLRDAGWLDGGTAEVQLRFATYSERAAMFALTGVTVDLSNSGVVHPRVASTAAMIEPYPEAYVYALDCIYVVLLVYKLYQEAHQIWHACRTVGWDGFVDYWSVWNVIDWTDVILGSMGIGFWISCCIRMRSESLHVLLSQGDMPALHADVMGLSVSQLEEAHDCIRVIRRSFIELHLVFAANLVAILLKFFKAFEANPRLNVVTSTLGQCSKDIVHFMIVFLTVFLCFAMIAHVLFGGDFVEFYTTSTSINTGFYVLMGEFTWYADAQHYPTDYLPSGMPFILVNIWFFMYMFFVLLVLLNMLLAIILAHYTEVTRLSSNSMTLWQQCKDYWRWKVETRGFFGLHLMLLMLEDEDRPAHPDPDPPEQPRDVTAESLQEAFPRMPQRQAEFLMKWLETEKRAMLADANLMDISQAAEANEALVHQIQSLVRDLGEGLESSAARAARIRPAVATPCKDAARLGVGG